MRILVVHNHYQQRGGEDAVVDDEVGLLRARGHEVQCYTRSNDDVRQMRAASLAIDTLWSRRTTAELGALLEQFRPDVMHVHNTFPLISPSAYWAASRRGIAVVQTLHNFRLHCPQAMYLRDGNVCERCLGRVPLDAVRHACYHGSRLQTGLVAGMLVLHRSLGSWSRQVTRFIALNRFCRDKFIDGGLPAEKIRIKPNFVDFEAPPDGPRSGLLFVGRLSQEKGVEVLATAAGGLADAALTVAGDGPATPTLAGLPSVRLLGAMPLEKVRAEMARALALVLPSIWYENFPRTLVEAYASGLPVIASRIGALADLVIDGETGLLFPPGDASALAERMRWAAAHPQEMARMGRAARAHYERHFTAEQNYPTLMSIYDEAIAAVRGVTEMPHAGGTP